MWIFTKYGFYSVVCARQGNGRHGSAVDPARMMVRARVRDHLEALARRYPGWMGGREIEESTGTDYAYRVFVPKTIWTDVLAALSEDVDYDNFKSATARHQPSGSEYEHALHAVWAVMNRIQRTSVEEIDQVMHALHAIRSSGLTQGQIEGVLDDIVCELVGESEIETVLMSEPFGTMRGQIGWLVSRGVGSDRILARFRDFEMAIH
jgi:hypothetical protein